METEITNGKPIREVLSSEEISKLPSWIRKNLETAKVIGPTMRTIELEDGRRYSIDNTINDLTGAEWAQYSCSVVNTRYLTQGKDSYAHHIRKIHPTPKPPQLMKELIEFFTKENEIVLDYFMGVGGSLLGASLCGRRGAGIELNKAYVDAYKHAAMELNLPIQNCIVGNSDMILKDSKQMHELLNGEEAGLILIDPPYSNMMSKPKTGADIAIYGNQATPFTDSPEDLGNLSQEDFIPKLKSIIEKSLVYLKKKGYLIVFCKDMQPKKKELHLLHAEIISALNEIPSLYYRGLKIWADQTVKLFPYGYPFDFVANQIHQYILIFRKY